MAQKVPVVSKEITLEGERYSLDVIPKTSAKLVLKQRNMMSSDLDLAGMIVDLKKLGNFIRVAYYGVAGCTDLQIKVQKIGFTVVELSQESDVTIILFKNACGDVLETLHSTYLYLLDGVEDAAVDNLQSMGEIAKKMQEQSDQLREKFEEASHAIRETLEMTIEEKGKQEGYNKEMKELRRKNEMEAATQGMKKEYAKLKEKEKKSEASAAEKKEDEAEEELKSSLRKAASLGHQCLRYLADNLGGDLSKSNQDIIDNEKRVAEQARKDRLEALKEVDEQRKVQLEANLKLMECVHKISRCREEEGISMSTIEALHGAEAALAALAVIMLKASKFWLIMHDYCRHMGSEKMVNKIERFMDKPEERRMKIWCSTAFKEEALLYCSKWVALQDICLTYRDQVRLAQEQMYLYMQETPTRDQARKQVPALTKALSADLTAAIDQLKRDDKRDQEERRTLERKATTLYSRD